MKYNKILSVVPQGETFDESAIQNEGVWVSKSHLDNVENALVESEANGATATERITELETLVTTEQNTNADLQKKLETSVETIDTLKAQIAQLEKGDAKKPAAAAAKDADDFVQTEDLVNDPNNSLNKAADNFRL